MSQKNRISTGEKFVGESYSSKGTVDLNKSGEKSASKILGKFNQPLEVIQSPEIQSAAKAEFILDIRSGLIREAIKIRDKFSLPPEFTQSSEVQSAAKDGVVLCLKEDFEKVIKICDEFILSPETIQSPEVQSAALTRIVWLVDRGYIDCAEEIRVNFTIPLDSLQSPEVQAVVKERLVWLIRGGKIGLAIKIRDNFSVSPEVVQSPEVQSAVKELMVRFLETDWRRGLSELKSWEQILSRVFEICDIFNTQPEVVQSAAVEGMIFYIEKDGSNSRYYAEEIRKKFNLPLEVIQSPEVQSVVMRKMIEYLKDRSWQGNSRNEGLKKALEIRNSFNSPPEVFLSPEVKSAARERMLEEYTEAEEISKEFVLKLELPDEFILSERSLEHHKKIPPRKQTLLDKIFRKGK